MGTATVTLVLCTITLGLAGTSLACNGYQMKVNHIQNCNPKSIIKLQSLNVTLDKDCNIIPSGCISTTRRFETAEAHYVLNKPPLPTFEDDVDLCYMAKNRDNSKETLDALMLPKQCPVNPTKTCGGPNNTINISKYKNRLALVAGTISLRVDITHNNGVSCIDVNVTIEKPRRG